MKPSEQGSFSRTSQNESKEWYTMIKTYKNIISQQDINASAENLQNRAQFSEPVKMSPNNGMLQVKLMKM